MQILFKEKNTYEENLFACPFSFLLVFSFSSSIVAEGTSAQNNLIPSMTSNDAPLGHATASSVWISGDGKAHHQPFRLFNGDMTDVGWSSKKDATSGWVAYEFNSPVVVNEYALLPRQTIDYNDPLVNYKGETPKDFTFEAWDGTNWIILDSEANIIDWKTNVKKYFLSPMKSPIKSTD